MSHLIYPRISEKAFAHANDKNVYTFVVPSDTNKFQIKDFIEKEYEVSVTDVNISILKGKHKRFMQKRGKQSSGHRQNIRKAYVTLKKGDVIPVFAATEPESSTPAVTANTKTKKEKK